MGLLLFIVSIILTAALTMISFVVTPIYYVITFKWRSGIKQLDRWLLNLALSVDQFGNVSCSTTLQILLTKKGAHSFGNEDDTVSYCLGRAFYQDKLTPLGKIIVKILNTLDTDHVLKAVAAKVEADQDAIVRLQENKYFSNE